MARPVQLSMAVDRLRSAPAGTQLDASVLVRILGEVGDTRPSSGPVPVPNSDPATWRAMLWTVPAETRLGIAEVAEALGRPRSWIYARTGSAENSIPHRKLDGGLVFTAGELRTWIRDREDVIEAGPMESTEAERRGLHAM